MLEHAYDPNTWLPYLAILSETFKAVIWPFALLFLSWTYRDFVSRLIEKLRSFSSPAFNADFGSQNNLLIEKAIDQNRPIALVTNKSEAFKELEKNFESSLESIEASAQRQVLIEALTWERLERHFQLVYYNIYSRQISALEIIASRGPVSLLDAKTEYKNLQSDLTDFRDVSFENYMSFLVRHLLIVFREDTIEITPIGRDFLDFMAKNGLSKATRPY